jgi:tRNA U55 pseudouridine synthase TruB
LKLVCGCVLLCPAAASGAATRLTPKFEPLERVYSGSLTLGVATTTFDATGTLLLPLLPWPLPPPLLLLLQV